MVLAESGKMRDYNKNKTKENSRCFKFLVSLLHKHSTLFFLIPSETRFKKRRALCVPMTMALLPQILNPFNTWDPFQDWLSENSHGLVPNMRVDWKETPESHVIKADLPGLKKEDVKVEVEEGRAIQISGERNNEEEEKEDRYHKIERGVGRFFRRLRLPENAKMDRAMMEDGVLTVTVPKEEPKKPESEVKAIEIVG